MPIYEYECADCGSKFELLQSFSQANGTASCPQCRKTAERVVSRCASFSRDDRGIATPLGSTGGSCAGCGSGSCGTCAS